MYNEKEVLVRNPKVTVIIPTYNSRGGLKRALDSVLNQTYNNLEVIVIDDNNPNTIERQKTEEVMLEYNKSDIIYLKHEINKNGASARNTGIYAATGDYIAFLDDDDEWFSNKIEKQLVYLENNPEYDCVYCLSLIRGKKEFTIAYEDNAIIPLLMNRTKMFTPSLMFTRQSLLDIEGFNESFRRHQDYELLIKFFAKGYKICCLKEVLINIHGLGGNTPNSQEFILIKDQFLKSFDKEINKLELKHKGIKSKITVANYVVVLFSALSNSQFNLALKMLKKYFPLSPITFIKQFLFLTWGYLFRRLPYYIK